MSLKQIINLIIIALLLSACGSNMSEQDPETKKMAERLAAIYERSFQNVNYPYHNTVKAEFLAAKVKGLPITTDVKVRYEFYEQLINAGRIEEGIDEIKTFLKDRELTYRNLEYFKLLGIAYMQLAENNNCVHHAGEYACVMPMTDKAIHTNRTGSEEAIKIFEQILTKFPREFGVQWLLNISYMTLGEYPNSVPKQWQIELNSSDELSLNDLPNFTNQARKFKVDVMGHAGSSVMDDFDQDGYLDIIASGYFLNEQLVYFKNKEGKGFENISKKAGLHGINGGLNFIHGDINNDGFPDLYVTRGAWLTSYGQYPNSLLLNDGQGNFVDRTETLGLTEAFPSQTSVFADFNQDGWLDLFVGYEDVSGLNYASKLYINQNGKKFVDYTKQAGIQVIKYVKGVTVGDINNDGLMDIYCSVFGGTNVLLKNTSQNGKASFENVTEVYQVAEPLNSFPCVFFDYDNDGWEDLFVSGYYTQKAKNIVNSIAMDFMGMETNRAKPILYRNVEGKYFEQVTEQVGLDKELYVMGFNVGDLNGDGWQDLFLGTGEFSLSSVMPNRVFLNKNGQSFQEVTFDRKFGQIQKGHGVSFGDFDNDGDEDIYHVVGGGMQGDVFHNILYENEGNDNNWITLQLVGKTSNKSAIGAKVEIHLGNRIIHRRVNGGGSFGNNSLQLEVGIKTAKQVDKVIVHWNNSEKTESIFENLVVNQKHVLEE